MKTLQFKKDFSAPAKKVYNTMLGLDNIATYEQWTAAFNPGSTYEGSWEKGTKILFVGPDQNGKRGGMVSEVADNQPYKFVSIRHYGLVEGDLEITEGPKVEPWSGSMENYTFEETGGVTTVTVDIDMAEDYVDMFNDMWPKALTRLKEICES